MSPSRLLLLPSFISFQCSLCSACNSFLPYNSRSGVFLSFSCIVPILSNPSSSMSMIALGMLSSQSGLIQGGLTNLTSGEEE